MKEKEMALKNLIVKVKIGSQLYGTETETSDTDYAGVFIPDKEYVYGFKTCKNVDLGHKSKLENGKNAKDAIDFIAYDIREFFKLALKNNPNIIEILFADDENIVFETDVWKEVRKNAKLFLHKGAVNRFVAYAKSQRHKMEMRSEHIIGLENGLKELKTLPDKAIMVNMTEFFDNSEWFSKKVNESGLHMFTVGDLNFQGGDLVKKVRAKVEARLDKASNRKSTILKYGYDTKFASHLIRLLYEGIDVLERKALYFPLSNARTILDIKMGVWKIEDVLKLSEDLLEDLKVIEKTSTLRKKPLTNKIEKLLIKIMNKHYNKGLFGGLFS